ncbi:Formate hydrogenlyase transcriptional activator [Roseivivax jejudonensis]|uniref:Nif-specific regulatory protein n=1 Tax=Roseivivax jejudonensis TaxID=1529041 RepID=A0A1X6YXL6_9RHOB|nr:sigma 54-interacting transcriptional regulator [Roseivivax jejudonensis]SLN34308.1 Formate hydrogenlyase transcriptional activator [Roseivivax jejudonensis]
MLDGQVPFDSILAAVPDAAVLLDASADKAVGWNDKAEALLGLAATEGHGVSARLGSALPRFIVFLEEVEHRGAAWTRDIELPDAPRCEIRGRPVSGVSGLFLVVLHDLRELERHAQISETADLHRAGVGEWKRAQGFFTELERQNQLILNAAGEGIYGVNAEGKTTFVNRAAQEMLGWTSEDLLGRDMHALIHHHHLNGDVYHAQDCPIYRAFRFEQVHRIEDEVFWRKDGRPIRVEYVSTPIYDQKMLAGAVIIFRDITERKENERRLREAMDQVAELRDRLEQENAYLQEAISTERAHHDILGHSPQIRQLLTKVELVARTDATVVITGEPGTGKSLVATEIHKESDRGRRPLIHFKCGAVAPDAVDAELFGQVRGASAGALRDRPGKLELAHGGTLFLEDVEELPPDSQGRLLHALQDGAVTRLGDTRARAIDVRVIAATARSLDDEVRRGRLREDLRLFLDVFPIACTPLRDRPEDIPVIATHLLQLACARLYRDPPIITERTMQELCQYHWPGNVRELRNVIERSAILSTRGKLVVELGVSPGAARGPQVGARTEADIQQAIRENLLACLREADGKVAGPRGAAALLGVPPTTFYSRLRAFGIKASEWDGHG